MTQTINLIPKSAIDESGDMPTREWIRFFDSLRKAIMEGTGESSTQASITLTDLTATRLVKSDSNKKLASLVNLADFVAGTANQVTITNDGDGTITISTPQDTHTGATPTFAGILLSGLAASRAVFTDGSKNLVSKIIIGSDTELDELGTATYDDVQDWFDITQSAGVTSGGTVTSDGDGSITVAAGTGMIRSANSGVGDIKLFDWAQDTSLTPDDAVRSYISIDYNSGTPQAREDTSDPQDYRTIFNLATVFREGNTVYVADTATRIPERTTIENRHHLEETGFHIVSGGVVSESGTRYLGVSALIAYLGLNRTVVSQIDTDNGDSFDLYYNNGSWQESSASQLGNTQYNNYGTGLADLTTNRYGIYWVYMDFTGKLLVVYGIGNYKLSEAQDVAAPANTPPHVTDFSVLIAKIIFRKSATNFLEVLNHIDTIFITSAVTDHNSLASLDGGTADQYYHMTSAEHSEVTTFFGSTDITGAEAETLTDTSDADSLHTHNLKSNIAGPTFTGTVTVPSTNFTIGSTTFSEVQLTDLTDGGDTTLHDHDGISENTTHRGSDGTDHGHINQDVQSTASPTFVTVKLSGLTDDYIPYHVNDATGLANGPTKTNVDDAITKKHVAVTLNASATTGGLSLSTQEISNRAATNAQTGYATAAHITAIEANTAGKASKTTASWSKSIGSGGTYVDWATMIAAMPDLIAHAVTVTIKAGTTLSETCNLKNKHGITSVGNISIRAEKYFPTSGDIPTADSATATTLRDAALATAAKGDDYFNGCWIAIVDGTGTDNGFVLITDYDDGNGDVVVASWPGTEPDNTSRYIIVGVLIDGASARRCFDISNNSASVTFRGIGFSAGSPYGISESYNSSLNYQFCAIHGCRYAAIFAQSNTYLNHRYCGIVNNNTEDSASFAGVYLNANIFCIFRDCGVSDNNERAFYALYGGALNLHDLFGDGNGNWGAYAQYSGQIIIFGTECSGSSGNHSDPGTAGDNSADQAAAY
jgi:hypothetical protein